MTGIYAIHNTSTNKYYIGQAGDIKYRWIQHKSRLKCGTHENRHLQASYDLYGADNFEYFVVEECSKQDLDAKERMYICEYDSYYNGYNQDQGGAGCKGYKHTEELMKMRLIQNPKAVLQLDMNLNIVAEWVSCSHAGKTLGFSIRQIKACCNRENRQKTTKGFYFVYKEEYENNSIDWDYYLNINEERPIKVSQYDLNMNLVKVWDSLNSIKKETGWSAGTIINSCEHPNKTSHNFVWRYTDQYTPEQYERDLHTKFKTTKSVVPVAVFQYTLSGEFIKKYASKQKAAQEVGLSASTIYNRCVCPVEKSKDYIFRYETNNLISQ